MLSLSPHANTFFLKCDLNLLYICFRLSIWPNGHRESQKYEFEREIPRTNEAAGLIVCPLIQLKTMFGFASRRLFGLESKLTLTIV